MARSELLEIRISTKLKEKICLIAEERNTTVSELVTDYIERLRGFNSSGTETYANALILSAPAALLHAQALKPLFFPSLEGFKQLIDS